MKYLFNIILKYASFKGRASRKEFWLSWAWLFGITLAICLVFCMLSAIFTAMAGRQWATYKSFGALSTIAQIIAFGAIMFVYIIPVLALAARRLHDINLEVWFLWLGITAGLAAFVFSWWKIIIALKLLYIVLLCLPARKGAERFGPPSAF
jgi:uncharacterized membrane protein YhaH (DUF805 family)